MKGDTRASETLGRTTPIGRVSQPEEVGRVITFLLSGEASFVSGSYYSTLFLLKNYCLESCSLTFVQLSMEATWQRVIWGTSTARSFESMCPATAGLGSFVDGRAQESHKTVNTFHCWFASASR
jgi:hypothetical protein